MDKTPLALRRRVAMQSIRLESLERRALLSAAIGSQPTGALSGKLVFVSGGHGYTAANTTDGSWSTGRPLSNGIVEDMGNQDQLTAFANYAFNAGATVVPMRPVGHQDNEVVVDNGSATFTGTWTAGTASPYFSLNNGNDAARYMFATGSSTETAVARYTPNIPQAGFYPVYGWALNGTNRLPDQIYRITFAGGKTEVKVNHQRVGKGWIYLGTYYFNAGTSGYVEISNKTSAANPSGLNAIADAIRFGNGMGDIDRGAGVSGHDREDEQSLYWIQAQAGFTSPGTPVPASTYRGTLSLDSDANVGAPPRWAAWMNDATVGPMTDRLFLSFHTNAAGGGISNTRGTLGLYNGNNDPTTATPNQQAWATLMGQTVTNELVALGTKVENPWANNATVTLDRSDIEFGEINNHSINSEFDATICEVGYHDNAQDAADLLDPDVRQWVARASVHAMVKYFNQFGGGALNFQPDAPTGLRATTDAAGNVTLHWLAPVADGAGAGAPTGYMVYQSANGYGFDGGTLVSGGATLSLTIPANQLAGGGGPTFFRVTAINAGGQSLPAASEVAAARRQITPGGATPPILIVNGFDRMDRASDARQTAVITAGGTAVTFSRVRDRYNNTRDYTVQAANAIAAFGGASLGFDSCQNDDIRSGAVNLNNYKAVIWLSGEQSTADHTFTSAEQTAVTNFINGGGRVFVSGSEIGWDLVAQGGGSSFFNNTLHAGYVADDANTYAASGAGSGAIFAGISLSFDNGTSGTYDVDFPDALSTSAGSTIAMNYTGGTGGGAAMQWASGTNTARVVTMGFPFETITTAANRNAVMAAVLNYFALTSATPGVPDLEPAKDTGISSTDNLTRLDNALPANALQFLVTGTTSGSVVTVYADGVPIGTASASGTSMIVLTNGSTDLADGAHTITATQTTTGKIESALSSPLTVTIDTAPPQLNSSVFRYLTGHSVQVQFSESVSATFANTDLSLTNLTTSTSLPTSAMNVSNNGNGLETITFPGASANGVLADGNWEMTIATATGGVTDAAGNPLSSANTTIDFFVLSGDANHDRSVDTLDFNALASNFGKTGTNWSQADFNYDGVTDTLDFNALAGHFGQTLPPAAPSAVANSFASAFADQLLQRNKLVEDVNV